MAIAKYREPPKPEDARPLFTAKGEVPEGKVRGEVTHRCWASKNDTYIERLFVGDVFDFFEAEFEVLDKRNWVKAQWKPTIKK